MHKMQAVSEPQSLKQMRSSSAGWDPEVGRLPQRLRACDEDGNLIHEIMDNNVWILCIALVFYYLGSPVSTFSPPLLDFF